LTCVINRGADDCIIETHAAAVACREQQMRARSVSALNLATSGVVTTGPETSLADCARLMRAEHVGSLIIIDDAGPDRLPVGIVTDRDIVVEAVAVGLDTATLTAGDVMAHPLATVGPDEDVMVALARMREHGVRRLAVVDAGGQVAGILAIDNLLEAISEQLASVVNVLKAEQTRETHLRR
jgi:CBS domain-containing protein